MNSACLVLPLEKPEWRHSSPYLGLAVALHAAVLFYPLRLAVGEIEIPPLSAISVQFAPPAALPMAAPPLPKPAVKPVPQPEKARKMQATPVLAVAPESSPTPPAFVVPAAPPAPPAPPAPLAVPAPAAGPLAVAAVPAVTAARFDAAYLHNPRPAYPPVSRRLGEEGRVLLRVRVGPDGLPAAVDLEKSSNFERLDEAARQVVTRWRFVPARRGDEPIEASVIVPIVFRLDG